MKNDYKKTLQQLFKKYIPEEEYAIFLFGSRAAGNNHDRSDIDVGVWGIAPLPANIRADIESAIEESSIPYFVDIIDFSLTDEQFRKEALKEIILWSHPKNLSGILKA